MDFVSGDIVVVREIAPHHVPFYLTPDIDDDRRYGDIVNDGIEVLLVVDVCQRGIDSMCMVYSPSQGRAGWVMATTLRELEP